MFGYLLEGVDIDMIGPLPRAPRPNGYIQTTIGVCGKWVGATVSPCKSAAATARLILNLWMAGHGAPTTLLNDLSSNFRCRIVRDTMRIFDIAPSNTAGYDLQCTGMAKRFSADLIDVIATRADDARKNSGINLALL
jgi:hypothetical protein